jgi:hypothetical protein
MAMTMYTQGWNDHLPNAGAWMEGLLPYIKNESLLRCPVNRAQFPPAYGYAMNQKLSGQLLSNIHNAGETPFVFESRNLARNWSDSYHQSMLPLRHGQWQLWGMRPVGRRLFS